MNQATTPIVPIMPGTPPAVIGSSSGQQQYLTFSLGGELFAISIISIREIIENSKITTIPLVPSFIRGVINLRGAAVTVIDLAVRFGKAAAAVTRRTCIVIIEITVPHLTVPQQMGIVVDAVSEVLEISAADIEPPPAFGGRIRGDFISGMAKINGQFVVLLEVDRILSFDEVEGLAAIGQNARFAD
ncbi:MAG: chemotaxis protein CheW [Proteobacteria bacterium]|nr:chemotaxis protein CheW [Pseudomonadota bacterium]